jgi:hypothetical protein
VLAHAIACLEILMNAARPRARCTYLIVLPVACVLMTACSGGASSAPAAAKASSTPTAAAAAPSPSVDCDTCGRTEPVLLLINSHIAADNYDGSEPTTIDLSVDTPGSGVAQNLTWSSWPSGRDGIVAASATVTGTGTIKGSATSVTITLSDPSNGDPSFWQTLTEQIQGQQPAVFHYSGLWAVSASGGDLQKA